VTTTGTDLTIDSDGWLYGHGVERIPIHRSWYYRHLDTPGSEPLAVVAHFTATDWGTARSMAKRRQDPLSSDDREASWHLSIEHDGAIIQMAPLLVGCWHAGGKTARAIPGLGPANRTALGFELVGYGKEFPRAQVDAYARALRACVKYYPIKRENAMWQHSTLDPKRKTDPGPVWMRDHAAEVLDYAYR
jgi:N-acetyl-anhydromuramyl-L-alanine amidase AmpD